MSRLPKLEPNLDEEGQRLVDEKNLLKANNNVEKKTVEKPIEQPASLFKPQVIPSFVQPSSQS